MSMRSAALLAALTLGGCGASLFKSSLAPPALYVLNAAAVDAAATVDELPADLAVLRPRMRAGLGTDRIAALYPDQHLDYFAHAHWSGPLDEVLQDLAIQVFQARAGLRNVGNDSSAFASAYWLEVSVMDFAAEYAAAGGAPVVHVRLQARIGSSAERRVLARFEADTRRPAAENRLRAIVQAYDQAANAALTDLAAQSHATLAGASLAR